MTELTVSHHQIAAFIAATLEAAGLPADDARTVGELMAEADLQGSEGHGVFRLPQYIKRIEAGGVNRTPDIRIATETAATPFALM